MNLDPTKVAFLQGLLAGISANGQLVFYDEVRRLVGCHPTQMGTYLGAAREGLDEGADFCTAVVSVKGTPGDDWWRSVYSAESWAQARADAHRYWKDRKDLNNTDFETEYGATPPIPAKKKA